MFYIFLILCSISFLLIYKLYFKVDLFIILGYLFIIIISIILYYYLNILDVLFYYFIFSFLYLSFVLDLKEYWIADLTIISVMFLNIIRMILYYLNYNKINFDGTIYIFLFIFIILLVESIFKKELIGFGDLKLFFVFSINKTLIHNTYLLLFSSIIGIIFCMFLYKKKMIPFGPSIMISYVFLEFLSKYIVEI